MKMSLNHYTIIICSCLLIAGAPAMAQTDDKEATTTTEGESKPLTFEDKLVALAIKNNPDMEILMNNQNIAKYNMRKSRWNWVNQIQVQGNLNEFTLNPPPSDEATQQTFFPRYNISLTLPLGVFGTRGNEVKISKQEFESTDFELMKKETEIRKQVLTLYGSYELYNQLLTIQNQKTEDEYTYYKSIESDFTDQRATMKEFKAASNTYNLELEKKYTLMYELKAIKIALESLIGMTMEEAEKVVVVE